MIAVISANITSLAQVKDSLLRVLPGHSKDTQLVKNYIKLSSIYFRSNYDSAYYYALKANQLATELNDQKRLGDSYMRMGNAFNFRANYDSALWAYNNAFNVFEELDKPLLKANALNNLGLMYRYMADYPKSVDHFMRSLDLKKEYGTEKDVGAAFINIGIIYAIQMNFAKADSFISNAIEMFAKAGDSLNLYSAYIDKSSILRELGEYQESNELLKVALEFQIAKGRDMQIGICYYNMGVNFYESKELDSAKTYFLRSKEIFERMGNKVRVAGCNTRIITILYDQQKHKEAEQLGNESLLLFESLNSPIQQYTLHKLLSDNYAAQSKFKEAYEQYQEYEALKDSLDKEDHELKILEMETQYQKEINQLEIKELTKRNEIVNYILIGLVVIGIAFALMFYQRTKNKKKVNDTLREKNSIIQHSLEEKEVLLREIHHRVQNNLQFVSSLLNLQGRRVKDEYTLNVLMDCKQRIQSMALIHQKLYQENSLKDINFLSYTQNLLNSLKESYATESRNVKTLIDVDPIKLDINTAIPLGLILNELIINSFKYAFNEDQDGTLHVSLHKSNSELTLIVEDDGIGLPKEFDIESSQSFGYKLVKSLASKLKAELTYNGENGTSVIIVIKNFEQA